MSDLWNPAQYDRFKTERAQPFYDLLELLEARPGMRIVDLGCGTGELTRKLHRRFEGASTLGIDCSESMLSQAGDIGEPGLQFRRQDILDFEGRGDFDLIFSNAALQWLPQPEKVLERLTEALAPGGQLAVQVPANFDHLAHLTAAEVAGTEPFQTAMESYRRGDPVLKPDQYARALHGLGFQHQQVRLQVYPHLLPSREALYEWMRGTLLLAYLKRLPEGLQADFLEKYRTRLMAACPDERPFFFPFKRILIWGKLP